MPNATRFVEVNWKPNRERLYGAVELNNGAWRYTGDYDQCADCGGDAYSVDATEKLLRMKCKGCGTTYRLMED